MRLFLLASTLVLFSFIFRAKLYYSLRTYSRLSLILLALLPLPLVIFSKSKLTTFWVISFYLLLLLEIIFNSSAEANQEKIDEKVKSSQYLLLKIIINILTYKLVFLIFKSSLVIYDIPSTYEAIVLLIVIDFKQYWIHRGQHHFTKWWDFHTVHHTTNYPGITAAAPSNLVEWFFLQKFSNYLIALMLGVSLESFFLYTIFGVISGIFSHADINLDQKRFYWLNYIINNPNYHSHHHSKLNTVKNYSDLFPLWDILFNTFGKPPIVKVWQSTSDHNVRKKNILNQQLYPFLKKDDT